MCRLLAYVGAELSPAHLVFEGEHALHRQSWAPRELLSGSVNADGYGVAWYTEGRPARIAEARPIWYDPELRDTLAAVRSGCVVAALRNGTEGLLVDRTAVPPLTRGRWTFVLNGYVRDFRPKHMRPLRHRLTDELYGTLQGSSDTETLFLLAVQELREGAGPAEALQSVVRAVLGQVGRAGEAQLNMVLADGERVAAVRTGTALETNSLYVGLHTAFAPGGVVLASEIPAPGPGWEPVDGHSWLEIDAAGAVRSEPLGR